MNLFDYTYNLVRQIPDGKVSSYGAVATALGDIRASRAVGRMMNQNPDPETMPCYKIVHTDGRLGGFGRGIDDKIRRLREVNIAVEKDTLVDFDQVYFTDFVTEYPLKQLREEQQHLSTKVSTDDEFDDIKTVGGIDVAYPTNEFDEACGVCAIVDYHTKELIKVHTVFVQTTFPYIPTYLSYRELPVITQLVKTLPLKPSMLMIDGNGILHPFRCGLASHTGVVLDYPTIGVAKSLLTGTVEGTNVVVNGEVRGQTVLAGKATKPIYVSPGHRISLSTSVDIVRNLCTHKIPAPLRYAHQIATQTLRKQR